VHEGAGFTLGQKGGQPSVTLTSQQLPTHTHFLQAVNESGPLPVPAAGSQLATSTTSSYGNVGAPDTSMVAMAQSAIAYVGGNQPHENRQPFLALSFCIALQGIFPSQN
jgi:microcystin-dependent protein